MKIPEEKIQEIRSAVDIVEYIGQTVRLKKRGKDYLGLCPFHNEKTPSFSVSPSKQLFYCFGCQRGGDVVKFVMEIDKVAYVEAIEILADKAHIEIVRTEDDNSASDMEQYFSTYAFAARFFYHNLTKTDEGKFAAEYFARRGFTEKTIVAFGLGYSLKRWDALVDWAKEEGIQPDYLERIGLAKRRDDGSYYDTFRGRAMFPIFNATGKVIAFGARKMYEEDLISGKYINSSETEVYHKSKVLYGLSQAKDAIRERDFVVLVEGYADLISVYQSGTKNICATSGTALTPEQAKLISRYTKNVTLVFDADSAGANAMMRGVDVILESGLDVRIVQLPPGEDPDSFVQSHGGEAFEDLVRKAVSFIDFKANTYSQQGKFDSSEGKAEAVRGIVESIAKIQDTLKRSFFIKEVAQKYSLYESALYSELEKYTRKIPVRLGTPIVSHGTQSDAAVERPMETPELPVDEREIFTVLFEDPEQLIPFVFKYLEIDEFQHSISKSLAEEVLNFYDEFGTMDLHRFQQSLSNEQLKTVVSDIAFDRYQLSEKWEGIGARMNESRFFEIAMGAIKSIKKKNVEKQLGQNKSAMKNASLRGEDVIPFLKKQQELQLKIKEIDALRIIKAQPE